MAIRIRVAIRSTYDPSKSVASVALVNSGFEADTPQILVPIKLARELGLHERMLEARIEGYGTVAGPIRIYVLPSSTRVKILEPDLQSPEVVCDTLISDTETEVLISDYLAGELGIVAEDLRKGLWRVREDPPEKLRRSYAPQHWI
ncbi:MAG: hypothetical protein RQ885_08400 [Desulfurococcales archaeon]|jgi:hypothetical protein|nr:hypothetical protein [Desulfurococcales archaeon]